MLAAIAFLMFLIIVMIRKKKENQTSILLRIMTSCLQSLSSIIAFNSNFPSSLSKLFGPVDTIGSSSEAFLSFDCFIEDTDLKAFTPSNEIYKVFLTFFSPFLLAGLFAVIWVLLYVVNKDRFGNLSRHIIISVICIIFLMHPAITKAALSLFQCLKVNEDKYKMRLYMEYECYSGKHLLWIVIVGLPSVLIWIIGAPILAFIVLFKHRDNLEDGAIKKYFLVLYQGFTKRAFYWEFVNTIRKILILSIYTILSFISLFYRTMLCIIILLVVLRIQVRLKPYKEAINNDLEIKAVIVGTFTLYWGILFEEGEHPGFTTMAFILLVIFNSLFFLQWLYYFLASFKFKNEKVTAFLRMFSILLCLKIANPEQRMPNPTYEESKHVESQFKRRVKMKKKTVRKIKKRQHKHKLEVESEINYHPHHISEIYLKGSQNVLMDSSSREEVKNYANLDKSNRIPSQDIDKDGDHSSLKDFQIEVMAKRQNLSVPKRAQQLNKAQKNGMVIVDASDDSIRFFKEVEDL